MREINLKIVNCQPIYFHHGDTYFFLFGFRAHALKTIARTTPPVKAVLPTRDFAVYVLLDSKVKTATKVNLSIIWLIKTYKTIQSRVKKRLSFSRRRLNMRSLPIKWILSREIA